MKNLICLLSIFVCSLDFIIAQDKSSENFESFDALLDSIQSGKASIESKVNQFYELASSSKDTQQLAKALFLKGEYLAEFGDSKDLQPIRLFRKALLLAESSEVNAWVSQIYSSLAFYHKNRLRNRDSSRYYFEKSLDLALKANHYKAIIQSRTGLSYLLMDEGNYPQAVELLLLNRAIIDSLDSEKEQGRFLNNLGHVYMQLGLNLEAIPLFRQGYNVVSVSENVPFKLLFKLNETQATLAAGETNQANELLKELQEIPRSAFSDSDFQFFNILLGELNRINGQYESALAYFVKAESIGQYELNIPIGKARILMEMGRNVEANKTLIEALQIVKTRGSTASKLKTLHQELSKSYERVGNPDSSLVHLQEHLAIYQEIHNEEVIRFLLNEMSKRLTLRDNQAKFEADLLNQKLDTEQYQRYLILTICLLLGVVLTVFIIRYNQKSRYSKLMILKNHELEKQKEEIEIQAGLLTEANRKANLTNDELNRLVRERTTEILEKNKILDEYAFINSHKLRSPIAAMKGLADILTNTEEGKRENLLQEVKVQVEKLDDIVHEIQDVLKEKTSLNKELISDLSKNKSQLE